LEQHLPVELAHLVVALLLQVQRYSVDLVAFLLTLVKRAALAALNLGRTAPT
jgi:hypothetical protein